MPNATGSKAHGIEPDGIDATGARTIAIVGGGFTGAAVALHLAAAAHPGGRRIVVFEPRAKPGAGLAYDTREPTHRINVPAGNMSLYPDDPESFLRYAEERVTPATDPDAGNAAGQLFPQRSVFGDYVAHELAPHLASGAVEHRRALVTAIVRRGRGWQVETESGALLHADIVVIAVSHPAPALPRVLAGLAGHGGLIPEGARTEKLDTIRRDDRVLIVGNGLTAADVIATLDRRGHKGPILAISRRGLRSQGHARVVQDPYGDFVSPAPEERASQLLRRIRATLREAAAQGIGWHAVFDAVRKQGQDIWRALPVAERRRLIRHLRPYWDVHRFRIAPQVEQVLDRAIAEGRLTILAASLRDACADADGIHVTLRRKGRAGTVEKVVDAVVVTTGPAHGGILDSQPFLRRQRDDGHLRLCDSGLGIACDRRSRALDAAGAPQDDLFIAGPLARGTFGELMGLPQVSEHALAVAGEVAAVLAAAGDDPAPRSGA
ncbi:MAG: FAD/NAD(P)-binding protein [Pseudochelatococcus sp.]|jgi:uncharacterized NAD(P)/FAD-binding protein YdhS|uniref:FAD/NAD(P)-binding protein n=1 Tax=Pseudochelatococcus sp. TaxID=2020869 RepID=UPI003D8DDD1E